MFNREKCKRKLPELSLEELKELGEMVNKEISIRLKPKQKTREYKLNLPKKSYGHSSGITDLGYFESVFHKHHPGSSMFEDDDY